jgi:hypothetical protein
MDPELVARLVNADAVAQDRIQAQGSAQVAAALSGVQDWADHGSITTAATEAGAVARSTSRLSAASADAYMTRILGATIGGSPRPAGVISINDPLRVGVRDWSSVYGRVADTVRLQVARGADLDQAVTMGLQRADTMVRWDSGLARREQWRQSLAANPQAIGWRRVIHPELSREGTCGLCIAAADRIYSIETLAPLHGRCHCTVAPVTRTADPGGTLNDEDLKRVYESASSTYAADLKRVRYNVQQHGELGPVLTDRAHDFRGVGSLPKAGPTAAEVTRRLESEIASLERSYRGLLARASAGENVIGPLAYQRDRIDALRARSLAIAA